VWHDIQASTSVAANPALQEPLIVENIPDDLAGEQVFSSAVVVFEYHSNCGLESGWIRDNVIC